MSKISILCVTGTHEKLQMAAMVAAVGAAIGDEISILISMNALPFFLNGRQLVPPPEGELGVLMSQKGVPHFTQLFHQAAEIGEVKLLPCSMALDLMQITKDDLDPALGPATGLTRFLSDAEGGHLLSF